jgi:hypothetical protein
LVPFVALAAVVASAVLPAAGAGCRARTRADAPAPRGVGFELPGGGVVTRGALLTDPPGREEAFVALVAGAASAWVEACRAEAAPHELSQFSFETDGDGALRAASPGPRSTARDRCLASRAAASPGPPKLPASTRVSVELALREP